MDALTITPPVPCAAIKDKVLGKAGSKGDKAIKTEVMAALLAHGEDVASRAKGKLLLWLMPAIMLAAECCWCCAQGMHIDCKVAATGRCRYPILTCT